MSFTIASRWWPLRFTVISAGSGPSDSPVRSASSISSSVKPRIAVSGVRISWLMLARNSDFALSASSAALRARSAASRASCSVAQTSRWLRVASAAAAPLPRAATIGTGANPPKTASSSAIAAPSPSANSARQAVKAVANTGANSAVQCSAAAPGAVPPSAPISAALPQTTVANNSHSTWRVLLTRSESA